VAVAVGGRAVLVAVGGTAVLVSVGGTAVFVRVAVGGTAVLVGEWVLDAGPEWGPARVVVSVVELTAWGEG
jgi:hypothetical protein